MLGFITRATAKFSNVFSLKMLFNSLVQSQLEYLTPVRGLRINLHTNLNWKECRANLLDFYTSKVLFRTQNTCLDWSNLIRQVLKTGENILIFVFFTILLIIRLFLTIILKSLGRFYSINIINLTSAFWKFFCLFYFCNLLIFLN